MVTNQEENLNYLSNQLQEIIETCNIGDQSFLRRVLEIKRVLEDESVPYEQKTPSIIFAKELTTRYEESKNNNKKAKH